MIDELDLVVLTHDIIEAGLKKGDVGTVVHKHTDEAFIVEFGAANAMMIALLELTIADVRLQSGNDLLCVREYQGPSTWTGDGPGPYFG